jgi:hypothetical protein
MVTNIVGSALLLLFTVGATENVTVYRWVDKNNVVHFSQHQPAHDEYTELSVVTQSSKTNQDSKQEAVSDDTASFEVADANSVSNADNAQCKEARENVRILETFEKVQFTGADGEIRMLSAKEKEQQLAVSKKQVEVYCGQ